MALLDKFKPSPEKLLQEAYIREHCLAGDQLNLYKNYFGFIGGFCKKPWSDDKYVQMVDAQEATLNIKNDGLAKFNLREEDVNEIEPIKIFSYRSKLPGNIDSFSGPTHRTTNFPAWTYLFFGDKELFVYTKAYDMLTGTIEEDAAEYFYHDIVSIHTTDSVAKRKVLVLGCLSKGQADWVSYSCSFRIETTSSGGFSTDVNVNDPEGFKAKILQARNKIREKKSLVRIENN